jgi:hypothetical protein
MKGYAASIVVRYLTKVIILGGTLKIVKAHQW